MEKNDSEYWPWLRDILDVFWRITGTKSPAITGKTASYLHARAMLRLATARFNSTARFSSFTRHRSPNVDESFQPFAAPRHSFLVVIVTVTPTVTGIHEATTSGANREEDVCVCLLSNTSKLAWGRVGCWFVCHLTQSTTLWFSSNLL